MSFSYYKLRPGETHSIKPWLAHLLKVETLVFRPYLESSTEFFDTDQCLLPFLGVWSYFWHRYLRLSCCFSTMINAVRAGSSTYSEILSLKKCHWQPRRKTKRSFRWYVRWELSPFLRTWKRSLPSSENASLNRIASLLRFAPYYKHEIENLDSSLGEANVRPQVRAYDH